ncbi:MAG: cysteine desulfurase [Clostridia bacterium]|nr:cysteine desulfurase [Clostridia bacterium]
MIYFDNSATTKIRPEVADFIHEYSINHFFNPSSVYGYAVKVKNDILDGKQRMIKLLQGNQNDNIIFTGSATEANNLALIGSSRKNKKILISKGEHPSVFETAKNLVNSGFEVDFIDINKDGTLSIEDLKAKMSAEVGVVSVIHVSNETGAINDLKQIGKVVKSINKSCIFHSDGVQAWGKIKENLLDWQVDMYTMSAHKIHGPKGVAALYVKSGINLKPIIFGGGQENGLRSGTENPAGILGFVLASELMYADFDKKRKHIDGLKKKLLTLLDESGLKFVLNSSDLALSNIVSISFPMIRGEVLLHSLEKYDICISTGSACSSKKIGNRVLNEMKLASELLLGNIRVSFSEFNTESEVIDFVNAVKKEISTLIG